MPETYVLAIQSASGRSRCQKCRAPIPKGSGAILFGVYHFHKRVYFCLSCIAGAMDEAIAAGPPAPDNQGLAEILEPAP